MVVPTQDSDRDTNSSEGIAAAFMSRLSLKYFRAGGFNQICLETAEDLRLLKTLDHTLWVASSCPTRGLTIDSKTLELLDSDQDGRIRCREILDAVDWMFNVLVDPSELPEGKAVLRLEQINAEHPEGAEILQSAKRILRNLGRSNDSEIALADASNRSVIYSVAKSNGDGVITPSAADDPEVKEVIELIIATVGGQEDISGEVGVTGEGVEHFFTACRDYLSWWERGHLATSNGDQDGEALNPEVFVFGDKTSEAYACYAGLRDKIEDYFEQTRLAAFDGRALPFCNFNDEDLTQLEGRSREAIRDMLVGLPLGTVVTSPELSLTRNVNPYYASQLLQFQQKTLLPIIGKAKSYLSLEDWHAIQSALEPYELWLNSKQGAEVESLTEERIRVLVNGELRKRLMQLIAEDLKLAKQIKSIHKVERLLRYHRDLFRLLNNYVSLPEFYDMNRRAVFQCGTLILDGCALNLVVYVEDLKKHVAIAGKSGIFLAYCEIRRKDQPQSKIIAAAITYRNVGRIMVGKNGVFYDDDGLDWDARVVQVVSNSISLSEATWAPFRRLGELFGSQLEKLTTSRQKALESSMETTFKGIDKSVAQGPDQAATSSKSTATDPSAGAGSVGGILAGGGVAVAALSSSFAYIAKQVDAIGPAGILYTLLVVLTFIFLPTILLGIIKLRKRDIGYILEACGWAINGRMRINLTLARQLTHVGAFPLGAQQVPFAGEERSKASMLFWILFFVGAVATGIAAGLLLWM